jgi:orotidine-5'-phosphate decarboxylase
MMRAAAEAACSGDAKVKLLGVTVLTSIDEVMLNNELKVCAALQEQVAHLAGCAVEAEMDGIVCGAKDLAYIRTQLPERFEIVTPGIRLDPQESHDQKRVATPAGAIKHGATLLVLGRAITSHEDPARAAARVCHSIAEAL